MDKIDLIDFHLELNGLDEKLVVHGDTVIRSSKGRMKYCIGGKIRRLEFISFKRSQRLIEDETLLSIFMCLFLAMADAYIDCVRAQKCDAFAAFFEAEGQQRVNFEIDPSIKVETSEQGFVTLQKRGTCITFEEVLISILDWNSELGTQVDANTDGKYNKE
jgi:hypothetical protein